jgi:hypothetical protein
MIIGELTLIRRIASIAIMLFSMTSCAPERNCDGDTFIPVRGEVFNVNTGESIPNAQIHIETHPDERQCPDFPTDFVADLETDQSGYFDLNSSAQGFVEFTMTITASGCETYTYSGLFSTFEVENPRNFTIYCPQP